MNFVVVLCAVLGVSCATTDLPTPVADLSLYVGGVAPWRGSCCMLSREVYKHFMYSYYSETTDVASYDVDYICESLTYLLKQMIFLQKSAVDSYSISTVITKQVMRKILYTQARTTTSVFNNAVLQGYRGYFKSVISSGSQSVVVTVTKILQSRGVPANIVTRITRWIQFLMNDAFSTPMIKFLERLEISRTLTMSMKLQKEITTILSAENYDNTVAYNSVRAAVRSVLLQSTDNSMTSYLLRSYYIMYSNSFLKSVKTDNVVSQIEFMLTDSFVMLNGMHQSTLTSHDVQSIVASVQGGFVSLRERVQTFVQAIVNRDKDSMVTIVSTHGSASAAEVSQLISRLGWINFREIEKPKNLLTEFKDLLGELGSYKSVIQRFKLELQNTSPTEQEYHKESIAFMENLMKSLEEEIHGNKWVHGYEPKMASGH